MATPADVAYLAELMRDFPAGKPLGQRRAIVVDATMQPGNHTVTVDAANWASGVYYYRLSVVPTARRDLVPKDGQADGFVATRKFILAR